MTPDFTNILRHARLSALAYDGTLADFTALGLRVAHVIHHPETDTQGVILHNADEIIVIFRGTTNARDWLTNVKIRKAPADWLLKDVGVHRGFLAALRSVKAEVRRVVQELRVITDKRLTITGHSLGGALAMLCALDLEDGYEPVHEVVTFGQPRVGDAAFRDYYNTLLGARTIRVVNQIDAVTRLPLWVMGYRHAGLSEIFFDAFGGFVVNPHFFERAANSVVNLFIDCRLRQASAARNHFMRDYTQRLEGTHAG